MQKCAHLYIDDSGTRHPDRKPGKVPRHGNDWFAMGGILVHETDETHARELHVDFCRKWNINFPLHSVEIRAKSKNFHFLNSINKEKQEEFYEDLYTLMISAHVIGIACVIDRPGYNLRYREKYGKNRWALCKSAFNIITERAAKYAMDHDYKLRIFVEKCNKKDDNKIREYYRNMIEDGNIFSKENSAKYNPLNREIFSNTLYDIKFKEKSSPMLQLADLYLWPICMGGYNPEIRPYRRLMKDGKLIDCILHQDQIEERGIKYYCFDQIS